MYRYKMKGYNLREKAYRVLKNVITSNDDASFMIFPYGVCGKIVKSVLEDEFRISPKYIVDNSVDNTADAGVITFDAVDMDDFFSNGGKVLLSSVSDYYYIELRNILERITPLNQIIDVFSPSMFFDKDIFFEESAFDRSDGAYARAALLESCAKEIYCNHIEGHIAECGVYQGDFSALMNIMFPDRKLYLFDTFSGFDERDKTEKELDESGDCIDWTGGFVNTSEKVAVSKMAWKNNIIVKKGYFPETAIGDNEVESAIFSLVSLDMDLYKPMKSGLDFFWDRLSPGGFILVDEARCKGMPRAREALLDFCHEKKTSYSIMDYKYDVREFNNAVAVVSKPYE